MDVLRYDFVSLERDTSAIHVQQEGRWGISLHARTVLRPSEMYYKRASRVRLLLCGHEVAIEEI